MTTQFVFRTKSLASTIKVLLASGTIGIVTLSNPANAEIYDNILFYSVATDLYMNASIGGDYSIHLDSNNATYANGGGYLYVGDTGSVLDNGVTLIGDNDGAGEGAIWLGNGSTYNNVIIQGDGDIYNRTGAITIETVSVSGSSIYNSGGALTIEGMTFSGTTGINTGSRNLTTGGELDVSGDSTLRGTLEVQGDTTLQGTLEVQDDATFQGNLVVQVTISSGDSGPLVLRDSDAILLSDGLGGELTVGLGGTHITDGTFSVSDGSFALNNTTSDTRASSLYDIDGINMSAGNTASVNILPDDVDIDADNNVTIDADNLIAVTAVTSTTVSGGGSTMTLDATGASFNSSLDMGGYQITNLADGVLDSDAATIGQLNTATDTLNSRIDSVKDAAFSGIAMTTALTMIPDPQPGQNYSLGVGYGTYKGHDAFAAGFTGHLNSRTTFKAGFGRSNSDTTAGVGIGIGW